MLVELEQSPQFDPQILINWAYQHMPVSLALGRRQKFSHTILLRELEASLGYMDAKMKVKLYVLYVTLIRLFSAGGGGKSIKLLQL